MRITIVRSVLAVALLSAPVAQAQSGRFIIDVPPSLAAKAVESVDINLDSSMLRLAAKFLSDSDADERATRDLIRKLDGIYVHSYEFEEEGYDRAIIDKMRSQLGPTWKRIVSVQSRTRDNVEIYAEARGDTIAGLVILAAEPRQITIVNIIGPVDLDKLAALEGQFGIPHVKTGRDKEKKHE